MITDDMMPFEAETEQMWTLSDDRALVRLILPPLPLEGLPEPLRVHLDFSADGIDQILERLSDLRSQMRTARDRRN
jgi:hypothetical protein